jgi:magnesium and cobalt exporter, CNNM family
LNTSSPAFQLVLTAALLLVLAFLWAAETALFAANRLKLQTQRDKGHRRARLALDLFQRPAQLLSTVLISNNIVNTALVVVATTSMVTILGSERGPIAAFAFATFALIVVEIVSKSVAAHHADRVALVAARPVYWVSAALSPIVRVLSFLTNLISRPFGGHVERDAPMVTSEEIQTLVRMGEEQGVLEKDERDMIHSIFEFGDTIVREVMVPRIDMVCIEADEPVEAVLEVIRTQGHSRIPVYDDTVDHIVGLVHVKDLLSGFRQGTLGGRVRDYARRAHFIPETKRLDELFREMRRRKVHMAIAVDEYGGTAGLVTIEDLLEEIVGPIQDEYDVEEPPIRILNDRVAMVDGGVNLHELNTTLHLELPTDQVDTVGGFVTSLLGHVPVQGDRASHDGVEFVVERVDGHRITHVKITRAEPAATES